jgi:AcrR family transcriptional regulator
MSQSVCEPIDPRIKRTRQLLQQALENLLETKEFDKISVQDVAAAATVNRATFYDHYADKFALLECMVGGRFHELLSRRELQFDGSCASALQAIVLSVCEYVTRMAGPAPKRQLEPHMESAIIAVIRRMLLDGLEKHSSPDGIPPALVAATAAWAIYGAVKEWTLTPDRSTPEELANTVTTLVSPVMHQISARGA